MSDPTDEKTVSEANVRRLLARAAELDVSLGAQTSRERLRESAVEAGIGEEAFDAAWRELHGGSTSVSLATHPSSTAALLLTEHSETALAPWWVRTSLWGVPDRKAAIGYYWLFTAVGVLSAAASLTTLSPFFFGLSGLSLFGIWTTSQAVRWLDKHGWTRR